MPFPWDGSAQLGHTELVTDGALVILGAAWCLHEHRRGLSKLIHSSHLCIT